MKWSKSQKWDALKATIICQKKGYWVFLVNQNQQNVKAKKIREDLNKSRHKFSNSDKGDQKKSLRNREQK